MKKLTAKQQAFVNEYLIDLNATQAAIRAGYSEKSAHSTGPRMLEDAGVKAAIIEGTKKKVEKTNIDAAWVLKKAEDLFDKCIEENQLSAANRALEIIGKHVDVQAFLERKQVEVIDKAEALEAARQRAMKAVDEQRVH